VDARVRGGLIKRPRERTVDELLGLLEGDQGRNQGRGREGIKRDVADRSLISENKP